MSSFTLFFLREYSIELMETQFSHRLLDNDLHTVRGKTAGAFIASGSFQWTAAVRALSILIIKGLLSKEGKGSSILSGGRNSLAASLDYAFVKAPLWLSDMFGTDTLGKPLLRRFVYITNPCRKRPGPVSITLTPEFLKETHISIFLNDKEIKDLAKLSSLLNSLEGKVESAEDNLRAVA